MLNKTIAEWSEEIMRLVLAKFDPWISWETVPKACTYLHSEVSEMFEAWRDNDKELVGEELADIAIRLFDTANFLGYDLEAEIEKKMKYNWTRPPRHGKINV